MRYAPVVLLSCVIGLAFSISPTFLASMSVFIKPLAAEFGWGRTQVSAAVSVSTLLLAVCSPLIGPMLDKYGPRRVILLATTLFAAAVASMATLNGNYVMYLLIAALIGVTGTGSNAFAYLSILPNWFDKRYGLSLGVAMIGVGLGQLAAPLYADLRGLPPLYIQVGTAETLLDDANRLAERARAAGVAVTLEVWDDMIHVFQAFAPILPEGQKAVDQIGEYLRARWS